RLVRDRAGRGVRLPRPERRREDDDRPDARHAPRADVGIGDGRGIGPGAEERRRDSATDRDDARGAGPLPAAERPREPRVLRRLVRGAGSERSHRLGARGGQPGRSEERRVGKGWGAVWGGGWWSG